MTDELLTTAEVAAIKKCSKETVRRHARDWGGFKPRGCRDWCFWRSKLMKRLGW